MTDTPFFRLLKTPIEAKGQALAAQIAALNANTPPLTGEGPGPVLSEAEGVRGETFTLDPADLALIPGSPFAYWVGESIQRLSTTLPSLAESGFSVQHGASSKNDFCFLRLWWEASLNAIGQGLRWVPFAKGGEYSPFYADVHLLINWENDAQEIHEYLVKRYPYLEGNTGWILHPENTYFRPGLTWPRRTTSGISVRPLPVGCIFADKGPAAFVPDDDPDGLLALLAVMNSTMFEALVKLQLGAATAAARSYEVGVIQRTPVPPLTLHASRAALAALARKAHDLQRERDRSDETTHAFCLPALLSHRDTENTENSLELCALRASVAKEARLARLAALQAEIDDRVFDLYGLGETDRARVRAEMGQDLAIEDLRLTIDDSKGSGENRQSSIENLADDEDEEPTPPEDLPAHVQNLLMWCVGVAFGRWDARFALDPGLLPALQGPFEPLPRCAPGALVGAAGLPPATAADIAPEAWLRARQTVLDLPPSPSEGEGMREGVYPLPIAWDGILVDDPTHPADIVSRVRGVLSLLWGDAAGAIEREACKILGFKSLRDYFRDPRQGFFAFHIKRYSKSRRKAPIYWLLQSARRNYAVWLYIHRLRHDSLYAAGRNYVDAKLKLEQTRLAELKQGLAALEGGARKRRETEIERQEKLVTEVADFRKRLDAAALLDLPPDLNDGVVISIAPLWELAPWKEAQKTWQALLAGEYEWSTMAKQMRARGLVNRES
ncbi:MAG: hypothetical protein ACOYZ7_00830 [Chloroflexota bacterium]